MNMLDNMIKYNEEKEEEATEVKNKEQNNKNNFQEENKEKKKEISFNNNLPGLNNIITNNKENNFNNKIENNIDEINNNDNIKEDNTKEHNIENDNIYNYNNQNVIYQDNNINFISNENNKIYGTNFISNNNYINYNNNMNNFNNYMSNNINNNQNIENNNNNYNKDIPQQKGEEKDIIDELIEKIRTNQQITDRESSKDALNRLDEEIKLGLERLNELFPNKNTYFDNKDNNNNNNNKIGKMKVNNRKFTDLLHEINKTLNDTNKKTYYKRNHYYDYKNMKIMKPRVYFQSESRLPLFGNNKSSHNNLYMSSIDGKLIVNGERKNLFSSLNLGNIYKNTGNNFYPMKTSINFNNDYNFNNLYKRRNYSIDKISSNFGFKKRNPSFNVRSANRFNKDYFKDELYKIQNLLFRDNKRSSKYY